MEIRKTTRPSFSPDQSFAGHPTWNVDRDELLANFSDSGNDFEIRIDVDDLRRLGATPGGFTIAHAIEKLIASN
jgi:hypothetical protein